MKDIIKDIDWSKAPKDATHYAYRKYCECYFVRYKNRNEMYYWDGSWNYDYMSGYALIERPEQALCNQSCSELGSGCGCLSISEDDISFDSDELKMIIKRISRKLDRSKNQESILEDKYKNNESNYNYHAGWNLGYEQGRISVLEDIMDDLNDLAEKGVSL